MKRARRTSTSLRPGTLGFAFVVAMPIACSGDAVDSTTVVERDSAGVRIVENQTGLDSAPERWSVDASPVAVIGAIEGDSTQQLYDVRAAALLSDGRVIVANSGTEELRVYDRGGAFLRSLGGEGEGPGEFRDLIDVWAGQADSVFAWDYQLRRISLFAPDGRFVRTTQPATRRSLFAAGVLDDGSLVLPEFLPSPVLQIDRASDFEIELLVHRPEARVPDTLLRAPHSRAAGIRTLSGRTGAAPLTFSAFTSIDAAGMRIAVATGRLSEVWIWDARDDRVTLVRWADPLRLVGDAEKERYVQEQLAAVSDETMRARLNTQLREEQYAEHLPTSGYVRVAPDGHIWLERWRAPWREGSGEWAVFDPEGQLVAIAELPAGLRVYDIRDDLIVGRTRGAMDVEQVVVYRIVRSQASP